jgi:DNA sulfur modification protein DndB
MRPTTREAADSPAYIFSALTGIQAGRAYYVAMFPLKLIPKILLFDEEELPPELRAQRTLNRARVPEIGRYLIDNPDEYVFSAITASVDGEVLFEPIGKDSGYIGRLQIPMTAKFIINDGQHRRAGIEEALRERPELGDETIPVVIFVDGGLKRSQQMFADLNKHAVRPTKSIGILYDLRNPLAQLSRRLIETVPVFIGLTETEKTTISNRSTKLFTLSSIFQGTLALLNKHRRDEVSGEEEQIAIEFWSETSKHIAEWQLAMLKKAAPADLRRDHIHAHGLALHALGIAGNTLLATHPQQWKVTLERLGTIDWSRTNSAVWEGRALIGGHVSKARTNVALTAVYLKEVLDLPLTGEERRLCATRKGETIR